MNIIIAGDGELGFHLAEMLSKNEDHSITVVDPRHDLLGLLEANTDILTLAGDPTSIDVLKQANIGNTDLFISVVHEESPNLLSCILAKKLGAKRTIARINDPEFLSDENKEFFATLGVDEMVCPEYIAALEIIGLLSQTGATEVLSFDNDKLFLYLIRLSKEAKVLNKTLDEIAREHGRLSFRAVAIHRDGKTIIPRGADMFLEDDLAYVITNSEGQAELFRLGGKQHVSVKNVMVVGGGRIGRRTALRLQDEMNVKLLDTDRERCLNIAQSLNKTMVINGDATDISLLEEEGIERMDAFISVTNRTETNILTCLHAKKYGVKRTIALVENVDYIGLSQNIGIDTIINKKLITAGYIARFTIDDNVVDTRVLSGIDAEVLEFIVKKDSEATKKPIYDLGLPQGAVVGGIIRNEESFIALGHFRIQPNDRVVIFALPEAIQKVSKFFR